MISLVMNDENISFSFKRNLPQMQTSTSCIPWCWYTELQSERAEWSECGKIAARTKHGVDETSAPTAISS
jgi:hypothetical protein